jgi:hypothetical protein
VLLDRAEAALWLYAKERPNHSKKRAVKNACL